MNILRKLAKDESGATAIEYGLIAGIIAVGLIVALTSVRDKLATGFNAVGTNITNNVK